MIVTHSKVEKLWIHQPNDNLIQESLEEIGRVCWRSEEKQTPDSYKKFLKLIMSKKHESILEHIGVSIKIITDRAIANEIVRHRLASYSQESTRYCRYSKDKFDNQITVIEPLEMKDSKLRLIWDHVMLVTEKAYMSLLEGGVSPEIARSVLPLALKTELWMTVNLRELRHIISLRCSSDAHPEIRRIFIDILKKMYEAIPEIFGDLYNIYIPSVVEENKDGEEL